MDPYRTSGEGPVRELKVVSYARVVAKPGLNVRHYPVMSAGLVLGNDAFYGSVIRVFAWGVKDADDNSCRAWAHVETPGGSLGYALSCFLERDYEGRMDMSVIQKGGGPMGVDETVGTFTEERSITFPSPLTGPRSSFEIYPNVGECITTACRRLAAFAPAFMVFNGTRIDAEKGEPESVLHYRWLSAHSLREGRVVGNDDICSIRSPSLSPGRIRHPATYTEAVKAKERADLPFAVFSTDPRVVSQAALKFEVTQEPGKPFADAVCKLWKLAEEGHAPERDWYKEAHELSERIGRPWHETPQPTIVEALSRASRENLIPLGFPTTMMTACNLRLQTQPQLPIRPRYLVLMNDPKDTEYVLVCDIKVGMRSLFVNGNPMPAAVFASGAFPFRLDMGVVQMSQMITLDLTSMRPSAITVNAVLMCESVEERTERMTLNSLYGKYGKVSNTDESWEEFEKTRASFWRSQADRDKDGPR